MFKKTLRRDILNVILVSLAATRSAFSATSLVPTGDEVRVTLAACHPDAQAEFGWTFDESVTEVPELPIAPERTFFVQFFVGQTRVEFEQAELIADIFHGAEALRPTSQPVYIRPDIMSLSFQTPLYQLPRQEQTGIFHLRVLTYFGEARDYCAKLLISQIPIVMNPCSNGGVVISVGNGSGGGACTAGPQTDFLRSNTPPLSSDPTQTETKVGGCGVIIARNAEANSAGAGLLFFGVLILLLRLFAQIKNWKNLKVDLINRPGLRRL